MNKFLCLIVIMGVLTPTKPEAFVDGMWGLTFGLLSDMDPPFANCYGDVKLAVQAITNIIEGDIGVATLLPLLQAITGIMNDCNSTYQVAIQTYKEIRITINEPIEELWRDIIGNVVINIPLLIGNVGDAVAAVKKADYFTMGTSSADVVYHLFDAYKFNWPLTDRTDYTTGALEGLFHGGYDVYTPIAFVESIIAEIAAFKDKAGILTHLSNWLNILTGGLMTVLEVYNYGCFILSRFIDNLLWEMFKDNWEDIVSSALRAIYNYVLEGNYYAVAYNVAGVFNGFFPAPGGSPL